MYLEGQPGPEETFGLIENLEQIVAEDPATNQPRIMLSRMLRGSQQAERAIEVLERALERDPFNARILYEMGTTYSGMGEWEKAQEFLERSLQIEPAQPNAYVTLSFSGIQNGNGVDVIRRLLKAIEIDPKDHELPGMVAGFLYNLRLIEEGDDFRDRVMAIAPTSEVAYQIELSRAIYTDDAEAGLASARRAIEDDIENRQASYVNAVEFLLRDAIRRGTVAEESAYLEQHAPGILDFEASSPPGKYRNAQFSAFDAWYTTLPNDFDPEENPRTMFRVHALRGDAEAAIDLVLENFLEDSVLEFAGWRQTIGLAQYKDIVTDPRMQAVLRDWEAEEAAIRESVRAYLADLHVST
jgi:tetratricopeptide (TPR) repeat protein